MDDMLTSNRSAIEALSLCPCNTGLAAEHCCGLDLSTVKRAESDGRFAIQLDAIGRAYHAGDIESARKLALGILGQAPGERSALSGLFNALKDSGAAEPAAIILERLARLDPDEVKTRLIGAQFYLRNEKPYQAAQHARMLIRLAPSWPASHLLMGQVFGLLNNPTAAEYHFREGLRLTTVGEGPATQTASFELALANALRSLGQHEDARALYRKLTAESEQAEVLIAWASLEEADRGFDEALALLDRATAIAPGHPGIVLGRATVLRRARQPDAALEALADLSRLPEATPARAQALFQRGQTLDSMGRYDDAFEAFIDFKRHVREVQQDIYAADYAKWLVDRLRDFFSPERAAILPRATVRTDAPAPIFIVGFPRSGTTLVEQTLATHPDIAGGDELSIIHDIANRTQVLLGSPGAYPLSLSEFWLGDRRRHVDTLRDLYLNEAAQIGASDPAKRWFTDKMPLNETHLGLIHLLFPEAPIIHLVRHPLDVTLSVFSNGLTHGFNCASSLETAAQHYALIADLIADYREALPLHYHAVRYEDLVTDQEAQTRELLGFIGAPYDRRVLDFHENQRPARTASYAQVTEKLYDRSRYRYRNYLKHLEPVIPILEPAIARLGYEI